MEELLVSVAVGLSLEGFDFVVESFEWTGADFAAVVVEHTLAVHLDGAGHFLEDGEFGGFGPEAPVVEESGGGGEIGLVPEVSDFFFHVVGGGEGLVDAERFVESLTFVDLFVFPFARIEVEVFGVFEDEPASAFEDGFIESFFGFALEFASEGGQVLVESFDHVEVIEDVDGSGEVFADGEDVGGGHVGGDGGDFGLGPFASFPEGFEGIGVFAASDEDDGPGVEIEDDSEVAVPVSDGDFIDSNASDVVEFGSAVTREEVPFEERFDGIPAELQMLGDGRDGHVG